MGKILIASLVVLIISVIVYIVSIIQGYEIAREIATEVVGASVAAVAVSLVAEKI